MRVSFIDDPRDCGYIVDYVNYIAGFLSMSSVIDTTTTAAGASPETEQRARSPYANPAASAHAIARPLTTAADKSAAAGQFFELAPGVDFVRSNRLLLTNCLFMAGAWAVGVYGKERCVV